MKTEKQKTLHAHIKTFLAALPPFAWAAAFVFWAFTPNRKELPALFTGAVLCLLGALATIRVIDALLDEGNRRETPFVPQSRNDRYAKRHPLGRIVLIAVLTRAALVTALYLLDRNAQGGYTGGLFERTLLWHKSLFISPAGRLIGQSGRELLDSVGPGCFPLFPAVCSAIAPAFPEPFYAGMAVSNLFTVIAAPILWEFVLLDGTVRDARRAVLFLLLSPISLVFLYANEASMALAFGLAALLCSRRKRLFPAALFALLSILAHPFSVLLVIVLVWDRLEEIFSDRANGTQKSFFRNMLALFAAMLPAVGLVIPVFLAEFSSGSLPPAIESIAAIPFFEETALRIVRFAQAAPAETFGRFRQLFPAIVPALPLVTALCASDRLRPKYGAVLILGVFSLSVLSLREVFPVFVSAPLLLAGVSAIGRHKITHVLLVLFSLLTLALCVYALGTGLL